MRKDLTRRQVLALLVATGLAGGATIAAVFGQLGLATAMVGVLGWAVFLSVVQLRRRLSKSVELTQQASRATDQLLIKQIKDLRSRVDDRPWVDQLAAAQRRILAAVETERLAAADRQRAVLGGIERSVREVVKRSLRDVAKQQQAQTQDVEALLQLYRDFRPRAPMPPSGRWAVNASGLLRLVSLIRREQPKTVLELGSGTSSVWIAYALEHTGGRLVSIDHSAEFAERTRQLLVAHGLTKVAEVRHAPLQSLRLDGRDFQWYAAAAFTDLTDVGLLVVDGPPGDTGPAARYPALRALEARLSARATVFVDDADRPDEQDILQRWAAATPGLAADLRIADRHAVLTYSRC
jgi:protein-L-isoaspartate O-methyltransferase